MFSFFKSQYPSVCLLTDLCSVPFNQAEMLHYTSPHPPKARPLGMSENNFFEILDGNGKNHKKFSWCSGREQEIQVIISVVSDRNGKTQLSFRLNRTGPGNLKGL